jgi:protein-disulfide isomerase
MHPITDGQRLRVMFRRLPLTRIPPRACGRPAGRGGRAAGPFWPAHELPFHHPEGARDSDLLGYANRLELDRGRLGVDLAGRRVWQRVQADADSGQESGAGGTPTLFINGRRHLAGDDQATLDPGWPPQSRSDDDGGLSPPEPAHPRLRQCDIGGLTCD